MIAQMHITPSGITAGPTIGERKLFHRVPTALLFQERRYVHFFFDKYSGNWLRLPIGWELHHPLIKNMVQHVEVTGLALLCTLAISLA